MEKAGINPLLAGGGGFGAAGASPGAVPQMGGGTDVGSLIANAGLNAENTRGSRIQNNFFESTVPEKLAQLELMTEGMRWANEEIGVRIKESLANIDNTHADTALKRATEALTLAKTDTERAEAVKVATAIDLLQTQMATEISRAANIDASTEQINANIEKVYAEIEKLVHDTELSRINAAWLTSEKVWDKILGATGGIAGLVGAFK